MELFTDDFRYYLNGHLAVKDKLLQARNANGAIRTCRRCTWAISR